MKLLKQDATSQKSVDDAQASYQVSLQQKLSSEASLNQAIASLSQAEANLAKAKSQLGLPGKQNASYLAALAAYEQAKLNYEFTTIKAPVDGYITNLNIRLGSQAVTNQPILALVDTNSYYIDAYFREDVIADITTGNSATVTLMSYPDLALQGQVNSLGWGIAQSDGSSGYDLLPNVSASFEWIRLAQRVPVRIHLDSDSQAVVKLRVGTTASVIVNTKSDSKNKSYRPHSPTMIKFLLTILLLTLCSCTNLGPDFESPEVPIQSEWHTEEDKKLIIEAPDERWWETTFKDQQLNQLIEKALSDNLDLKAAGLRVMQSRQNLAIAIGNQYPQDQAINSNAQKSGTFENSDTQNNYNFGLDVSWEMDFWGASADKLKMPKPTWMLIKLITMVFY